MTLRKPIALAALLLTTLAAAQTSDPLASGFANPPNSARPRVWWHWMNGNITEHGIDLDLEWMHRVGIGGFHTFDAALNTPTIVDKRLVYMTPEWKHAFNHAVKKANSLSLEVTIASSPGWSETGGPWVPPAEGMKKLVWSQTLVLGGKPAHLQLPSPPTNAGPFQGLRVNGPAFYQDVAVLAVSDPGPEPTPSITTSAGPLTPDEQSALLTDTLSASINLKPTLTQDAWVQLAYPTPVTIQSLAFNFANTPSSLFQFPPSNTQLTLERSDDGITFTHAVDLPTPIAIQRTATFPAITARYFRFRIHSPADNIAPFAKGFHLSTLQLFTHPRNPDFELKAGFFAAPDYYALPDATGPAVPAASVIDITPKMSPDGTLTWTPPPGTWRILRLGFSLTGKTNHPAPPEATGLEVDELSPTDVEHYVNHYLSTYADIVGKDEIGTHGIRFFLTDSSEVGSQNWTDDMEQQFRALRGYDLRPWLPALTGIILQSPKATDRFLWDYRRTIAELTASAHYDTISRILHEHHLGYYGEALENARPELGDDLEMRRSTDIPMGAIWIGDNNQPIEHYDADLRGAASIAHIYGQNLVGSESFTSRVNPWGYSPDEIKPTADQAMLDGVNRFMIHEMTHQPVTDKVPGLSLGIYGQWFGRNETWAEQAKPWIDYLSRCSFMLQQGRFNADLAYFYGEEQPLTLQYLREQGLPQNNGYDFINSDILQHKLSVAPNGNVIAASGATYKLIYLGSSSNRMTLPTLKRLAELVHDGVTIAGIRPVTSPSQADNPDEFQHLVTELWGPTEVDKHTYGKGSVIRAYHADEALKILKIVPDWMVNSSTVEDRGLGFVHRKLSNGDIYFVVNRSAGYGALSLLSFNITGKQPELYFPDTGERRLVSFTTANNRTEVPVLLDPNGSVFIVFRKPTTATTTTIPTPEPSTFTTLTGPWVITFEPNRGAPATATFPALTDWSTNSDPGIRYFSGHATYTKTLVLKPEQLTTPLAMDLGKVKNIAEVTINDKPIGEVWKAPYQLKIPQNVLHVGDNKLEIRVVNLWPNRIIGDLQPNATKYTFTSFQPFKPNSPLLPSGLLGPVQLLTNIH